jgi:glutamate racemase
MSDSIGIFDSGVGGYTIYQACVKRYPHHSFVLLADQLHLPYGDKSHVELKEIFDVLMNHFRSMDIHTILIACNTMSSLLNDEMRNHYPDLNFISIIEPTLSIIPEDGDVMILATQATLSSKRYQEALISQSPKRRIVEVWGRQLAKHIEEGDEASIETFIQEHMVSHHVDHIVLACTHYPLIKSQISQHMSANLIDSIDIMSQMIANTPACTLPNKIYTTANPELFKAKIKRIFDEDVMVELC